MARRIVILGGGYAGVIAALRLGPAVRAGKAQVTLVSESGSFVERIRLHQLAVGQRPPVRDMERLLRRAGVMLVRARITAIDRAARALELRDGGTVQWDLLVYCPGSVVDVGAIPGAASHAFTLSSSSVERLAERLRDARWRNSGEIIVVGGGLTGVEAAAEIAEQWPDARVRLVSREPLGQGMGSTASEHVRESLTRLGIALEERRGVREVHADRVELEDGSVLPMLACVWAGGFRAPSLARDAGLSTNALGQLLVDGCLRSVDDPDILGAGDAAKPPDNVVPMGCKSAMPMGAHAADNLRALLDGGPMAPFRYALLGYCTSLGRRDGLVELTHQDGTPTGRIFTGRTGAVLKELVCKVTWWTLVAESWRPGTYRWPMGSPQLHLLPQPADN